MPVPFFWAMPWQDAILQQQTVQSNENLKVLLPGNMKETVECADPIETVSIELQLPHVHLDKVRLRHVDACQFEHGGGDIDTGYLETRTDQEPRHWNSCPKTWCEEHFTWSDP
jgi:hypothetical protein